MADKSNYTVEMCHKADTLYGGNVSMPEELNWQQVNQLFTLSDDGHLVSFILVHGVVFYVWGPMLGTCGTLTF